MINVIASIRIQPGKRSEFLKIFKANVDNVREEKGCIEYFPAVDIEADFVPQSLDENRVTVIEKWESLEALRDHIHSEHMLTYKDRVKDMVEDMSLKILQEA